jgi:hypothetical protein
MLTTFWTLNPQTYRTATVTALWDGFEIGWCSVLKGGYFWKLTLGFHPRGVSSADLKFIQPFSGQFLSDLYADYVMLPKGRALGRSYGEEVQRGVAPYGQLMQKVFREYQGSSEGGLVWAAFPWDEFEAFYHDFKGAVRASQ